MSDISPAEDLGRPPGHYGRVLAIMAGVFVLGLLCNLALSASNLGRLTADARGLCTLIDSKIAAAADMPGPKLLFIGGSNLYAGVSAQGVSENVGMPAYNFGLQAGMGPRLILFEAQKVLRSGDTAVLVLEYSQYTDDRWNEVSSDVLFGCAADYFAQMGLLEKAEALLALSPLRIFEIVSDSDGAVPAKTRTAKDGTLQYGDRSLAEFVPTDAATRRRLDLYQPIPIEVTSDAEGPKAIASFVAWAREHGIKVVATWPNTIYFPSYEDQSGFAEIATFYERLGVPVVGRPQDAMYPTELFYDTQYHLNPIGISQRTRDMAAMLSSNRWLLPAQRTSHTESGS